MNPSGSKNKGRNFENKVATMLREAFPDARRVTVSGANPNDPGDVRFTKPTPLGDTPIKIIAECKKREKWSLDALLRGECIIWKWWEQAVSHCKEQHTHPVLVMAHNFSPPVVIGDTYVLGSRHEYNNYMSIQMGDARPRDVGYDLICVDLQEFIDYWKVRSDGNT